MKTNASTTKRAREICEKLLKAERANKIEKSILPSEVSVIDRLLERGLEVEDAYDELYSKLSDDPRALHSFFDLLQSVGAFWNAESNQEARTDKARLVAVNKKIERVASSLAKLLNERAELKNHSGFSCNTLYHPVDAIHAGADGNYGYEQYVKEKLEEMTGQFDLKYWPSLGAVIQAIADDAARAAPSPHDALTEAATEGPRAGLADTFRAFFVAIEEGTGRGFGYLPRSFDLTDRSVASLLSCALGLAAEQAVDAPYVKRLRQRQRERSNQS
ncbi:MAG: hypothetical protein AD742_08505 [Methylibium sp. NZG]|nr:MAG: hypothetical protein AD742_08505 [Methylibium sp. NZG]